MQHAQAYKTIDCIRVYPGLPGVYLDGRVIPLGFDCVVFVLQKVVNRIPELPYNLDSNHLTFKGTNMLYFSTRSKARAFAGGIRRLIDMGKDSSKRWAVKVI